MFTYIKNNYSKLIRIIFIVILLKLVFKYIITFPVVMKSIICGSKLNYSTLVTFHRYFYFAKVNRSQYCSFKYKNEIIKFKYLFPNIMNFAVFKFREYDDFNVKGKCVVDIGAATGDTAILFIKDGAKKVYGFELSEKNYKIAIENINLNSLNDLCIFEHCGVGAKKITSANKLLKSAITDFQTSDITKSKFKTLDEITQNIKEKEMVLKLDIEGFEYEIFKNTSVKTLKKYDSIYLEYHYGVQDIPFYLKKAGFEVHIKPITKVVIESHLEEFKKMDIGMILARRKIEGVLKSSKNHDSKLVETLDF